ncbi:MAG: hypothetical protein R3F59_28410 [Myxococcota bacterium]
MPAVLDLQRVVRHGTTLLSSDRYGPLASYPWGPPDGAPTGTRECPWCDVDQGWQQLVFQEGDWTHVLDGGDDGLVTAAFRVPTATWRAIWA